MSGFWLDVGRGVVGHLWLPMLGWSLVAGAVWWPLRRARGLHPQLRYRWNQALLFALPAAVVVGSILPLGRVPAAGLAPHTGGVEVAEGLAMEGGPGASISDRRASAPMISQAPAGSLAGTAALVRRVGPSSVVLALVGTLTGLWILIAAWRLACIGVGLRNLRRFVRSAEPAAEGEAQRAWAQMDGRAKRRDSIRILLAPAGSVPFTFGLIRPTIALPREVLDHPGECRMSMAHELAHVYRHDFAWALAEHTVCALFPFHPLVRRLADEVERNREAACDLEVLRGGDVAPGAYASLLCSLADGSGPDAAIAPALSRNPSHLKERIESMKTFADHPDSSHLRSRSLVVALVILASTTSLGACFSFEGGAISEERAGDSNGFVAEALDAGGQQTLARLDAQMAYLSGELDDLENELHRAYEAQDREGGPSIRRLETRLGLLQDMYEERLRLHEEVKLRAVADGVR